MTSETREINNEINNENIILKNFTWRDKDYQIKVLKSTCTDFNSNGKLAGNIFLFKKKSNKFWILLMIQVNDWRKCEDEMLIPDRDIKVDEEYNIINIATKNSTDELDKSTDVFDNATGIDIDDELLHQNTSYTGCLQEIIYFYHSWFSQIKTDKILKIYNNV